MNSQQDAYFIKRALKLAQKAQGWTLPNPAVGAVIVKNGKIIGEGYHKRAGLPHAEIEALSSLKSSPKGSTLYLNLEPCCHFGRTAPCTQEIIRSGITRVVFSTFDPNPQVKGSGAKALQKAGIRVDVGLLQEEARQINEAFFTYHEKKRPFIAVKFAASLDGKIATSTGDSKWITGEKSRAYSSMLRGKYQAICVGASTIVKDNPHLGIRTRGLKDPLRIIFDPHLRTSPDSLVYRDDNVLVLSSKTVNPGKKHIFDRKGVKIVSILGDPFSLDGAIHYIYMQEVVSLLVEGGSATIGSFIDARIVDKVYAIHAPLLIGGNNALGAVGGKGIKMVKDAFRLKNVKRKILGIDILTEGYL